MKTIVLLHGWGMSSTVFDELSDELASRFSVRATDLPGYGGSRRCQPYTLEQLAAEISPRAPESCYVVGWSLGAQVGLVWAHTKPHQVERLALIAATPCFTWRDDWACAIESAVLRSFSEALSDDIEGTLNRFVSLQAQCDDSAKRVARTLRAVLAARGLPERTVLEQDLQLLRERDLRGMLSGIAQKTLVVHGENDQLVPRAAAQYLARALPRARFECIPGARHAPFISNPRTVGRVLAEHFDGE